MVRFRQWIYWTIESRKLLRDKSIEQLKLIIEWEQWQWNAVAEKINLKEIKNRLKSKRVKLKLNKIDWKLKIIRKIKSKQIINGQNKPKKEWRKIKL